MKQSLDPGRSSLPVMLCALAVSMLAAGSAVAAATSIDEGELQALGFKVLVATTPVQQEWVQRLAPGKVKAVQRNGNKYFILPDASKKQVYVGGPSQYEAYQQRHPESQPGTEEAARKGSDARAKQNQTMQKATARDESNPYLGIGWSDLIW